MSSFPCPAFSVNNSLVRTDTRLWPGEELTVMCYAGYYTPAGDDRFTVNCEHNHNDTYLENINTCTGEL